MTRRYLIVHVWPTQSGLRKRLDELIRVLRQQACVERISSVSQLAIALLSGRLHRENTVILVYTSLTAPLLLFLRALGCRAPIYYMVRGDEITYAKQAGRNLRATVALVLQRLMNVLGCHFVFVSEDLKALFVARLRGLKKSSVLPNTLGRPVPDLRPFDGQIAIVGEFNTVKNVEGAISQLSHGRFEVHLFGHTTPPERWRRTWLHAHGVVADLKAELRKFCSLVVFPDTSAGFPNVLVEALEAGCSVVIHRDFPFRHLPISDPWRFDLSDPAGTRSGPSNLERVLTRLRQEQRDFKVDNRELIELVESDWEERVWEILR